MFKPAIQPVHASGIIYLIVVIVDSRAARAYNAISVGETVIEDHVLAPLEEDITPALVHGGHGMCRKLLILACSQAKRDSTAPLPAIERYDGPTFRVLR